jgi:hypothetical protein
MYVGVHVRRAYTTAEACLPSREELMRGVELLLEAAPELLRTLGDMCLRGEWRKLLPTILSLHIRQHIFRMVSIGGLYVLSKRKYLG